MGDGFCDDATNTGDCEFDGGDCCGDERNTDYCEDCKCKHVGFSEYFSQIFLIDSDKLRYLVDPTFFLPFLKNVLLPF